MAQLREVAVRFIYRSILPRLIWLIYKALSLTWRLRVFEPPVLNGARGKTHGTFTLAHWHGDELAFLSIVGRYNVVTITSTSVDGDLMDKVFRLMGGFTVRGSSTRGGISALKGLLRIVKKDLKNSSFAVDGPKGPIYKAKPGVFEVSKLTQSPIIPGGVFCSNAWRFPRSWNQTYLPKPFADVVVCWGEPLPKILENQDPRSPELALELENALHRCRTLAAEKAFAQ
jgi:lysophospholipid acyltransferase (LPLAT)-like uncharacterized protein